MLTTLVLAASLTLPSSLDTYIDEARRKAGIPGIAIAVVHGDASFAKGYGVRRLGSPETVDANTAYDIASLTKSFTAAAMATLVDEGKLRWDDTIRERMPAVMFPAGLDGKVTIRDLLAHRVGLQQGNLLLRISGYDREELIRRIRFLPQQSEFRTDMVYSNIMYALAAATAESVSGKTWPQLVQERLLTPLGMKDSAAGHVLRGTNTASGHAMLAGVQQPVQRFIYTSVEGASGVTATAEDMTKWLRFNLGDGTWNGNQIVSGRAMAEMHSPHLVITTTPEMREARQVHYFAGYGLGWQVMDYRGHKMLWHSGNATGMPSYMAILPKEKIGLVVMVNSWRVPIIHGALAARILDELLGLPTKDNAGDAIAAYERDVQRYAATVAATEKARISGTRPSRPVAEYAAVYADNVHGDMTIAAENGRLTLTFARGGVADLEHWHYDTFAVRWRDPVLREDYATFASFTLDETGKPIRFEMPMRRERVEARRR